jgi:hypothetical protein
MVVAAAAKAQFQNHPACNEDSSVVSLPVKANPLAPTKPAGVQHFNYVR